MLKGDQNTLFESEQTFDDKAAARDEIKRIKEAEIGRGLSGSTWPTPGTLHKREKFSPLLSVDLTSLD